MIFDIFIIDLEQNVGQAPSTKRSKRLAVKKIILRIRGALALCLKVALQYRPGLQHYLNRSLQVLEQFPQVFKLIVKITDYNIVIY